MYYLWLSVINTRKLPSTFMLWNYVSNKIILTVQCTKRYGKNIQIT